MSLPRHVTLAAGVVSTIDLTPDGGDSVVVEIRTGNPSDLWVTTDGTTPVAWSDGQQTNHWPEPLGGLGADGRWRAPYEFVVQALAPRNPATGAVIGPPQLKMLCAVASDVTIDRPGRWAR
jgi:hypothetical protein